MVFLVPVFGSHSRIVLSPLEASRPSGSTASAMTQSWGSSQAVSAPVFGSDASTDQSPKSLLLEPMVSELQSAAVLGDRAHDGVWYP
jgi:hypothetical protein